MKYRALRLKKNEDRRLLAGHLWIYSNEVDAAQTPLKGLSPGQVVEIRRYDGKPLGSAYANPQSLICARLFSHRPGTALDGALIRARVQDALALRQRLFDQPYYRLIHSEADRLPGLVVDRYGDVVVAQINTAGMEAVKTEIIEALVEAVQPAGIVLRNDTASRSLEGLEQYVETAYGSVPEQIEVEENGVAFAAPLAGGQKTGWFFDHRLSRARMCRYVGGQRVLDLFTYVGAWAVQAAVAGATEVVGVDSSAPAVDQVTLNAQRNNVAVETRQADVFDALQDLRAKGERFDVVIADPPAFIKRKKDLEEGARGYHRLNKLAMQVLAPGGILISASCSFHFSREQLLRTLLKASRGIGREMQVLEQGHQGPDHPIHPAIPESEYLKTFFCRVF